MLVAISIPIFTSQLEKSREAVDLSNMRAAYAECAAEALTDSSTYAGGYCKSVTVKQQKDGWVSAPDKLADTIDLTSDATGSKLGEMNKTVFVCVSNDGVPSLAVAAPANSKTLS